MAGRGASGHAKLFHSCKLSECYRVGCGVEADAGAAREWLTRAAASEACEAAAVLAQQ